MKNIKKILSSTAAFATVLSYAVLPVHAAYQSSSDYTRTTEDPVIEAQPLSETDVLGDNGEWVAQDFYKGSYTVDWRLREYMPDRADCSDMSYTMYTDLSAIVEDYPRDIPNTSFAFDQPARRLIAWWLKGGWQSTLAEPPFSTMYIDHLNGAGPTQETFLMGIKKNLVISDTSGAPTIMYKTVQREIDGVQKNVSVGYLTLNKTQVFITPWAFMKGSLTPIFYSTPSLRFTPLTPEHIEICSKVLGDVSVSSSSSSSESSTSVSSSVMTSSSSSVASSSESSASTSMSSSSMSSDMSSSSTTTSMSMSSETSSSSNFFSSSSSSEQSSVSSSSSSF